VGFRVCSVYSLSSFCFGESVHGVSVFCGVCMSEGDPVGVVCLCNLSLRVVDTVVELRLGFGCLGCLSCAGCCFGAAFV